MGMKDRHCAFKRQVQVFKIEYLIFFINFLSFKLLLADLVSLLVAGIADGIVSVPAAALSRPGGFTPAISAPSTPRTHEKQFRTWEKNVLKKE